MRAFSSKLEQHQSDLRRFASKYKVAENGCWHWTARLDKDGYPCFSVESTPIRAHRYSWQVEHGRPIPKGLTIDHTCHNGDDSCPGGITCLHRRCVRPDHLEAVTPEVNVMRGKAFVAQNARKVLCKGGHPFDVVRPDGARDCSTCRAARHIFEQRRLNLRRRLAAYEAFVGTTDGTCGAGHPWSPHTSYLYAGKARCIICIPTARRQPVAARA